MSTEIRELYLSEAGKIDALERRYKSLMKNLNNLELGETLDVLILGSVGFGICKEDSDKEESHYDHHPIRIKRTDEDRYLVKNGDGSLITDLNLKTEWRPAIIRKFGMEFTGISCKLIEPPNSTAYIY